MVAPGQASFSLDLLLGFAGGSYSHLLLARLYTHFVLLEIRFEPSAQHIWDFLTSDLFWLESLMGWGLPTAFAGPHLAPMRLMVIFDHFFPPLHLSL